MSFDRKRPSSTSRGYGKAHREERTRRVAVTTPHTPCSNCGRPLGPDSTRWHLPHTADRSGYLPGLHCFGCNIQDAARRGAIIANGRRKAGQPPSTTRRFKPLRDW